MGFRNMTVYNFHIVVFLRRADHDYFVIAPGLWYITGVAVRLAVDLGLHYEDGSELGESEDEHGDASIQNAHAGKRGRRQWMQDLRRRLWWWVVLQFLLASSRLNERGGMEAQPALETCLTARRRGFADSVNPVGVSIRLIVW